MSKLSTSKQASTFPAKTRGFTLIELITVTAVLGVLASMIIIQFTGAQNRAKNARLQSDLKQYQILLEIYANRNNGTYPSTSNIDQPISWLCNSSYLNLNPCVQDPYLTPAKSWGYNYLSDGTNYILHAHFYPNGNIHFFLCSNGKSGESTAGDPTSANCPI